MDNISEAIDKIADKLGVAVGQIAPYFDQYAQMKASVDFILVVAFAIALVICLLALIVGVILRIRDDDYDLVAIIALAVGFTFTVAFVLAYINYYKWSNFPDAMLLDMVVRNLAH